jgi:hypothetical protein
MDVLATFDAGDSLPYRRHNQQGFYQLNQAFREHLLSSFKQQTE